MIKSQGTDTNSSLSSDRQNILFLCTGNSCRSQMAEAIINSELGDAWDAFSAGTQPTGFVHPKAIVALSEIGIHHRGTSKGLAAVSDREYALVITVCDSAAEECPFWPGADETAHMSFPDPALAQGSAEEIMAAFRSTRDAIRVQIVSLLENL
jgi:arsenate reductase (thioredoxin)